MSTSRARRGEHVLRVAEYAARNLELPKNDREVQDSFDAIIGKSSYLRRRASAQWTPEFEKVLDSSHSMRVARIDDGHCKEGQRPRHMRCMACGRPELNCRYRIDLAGSFDAEEWCHAGKVTKQYNQFIQEYEAMLDPANEVSASGTNLPCIDKGAFIVGVPRSPTPARPPARATRLSAALV